jgi:hypothetical protein
VTVRTRDRGFDTAGRAWFATSEPSFVVTAVETRDRALSPVESGCPFPLPPTPGCQRTLSGSSERATRSPLGDHPPIHPSSLPFRVAKRSVAPTTRPPAALITRPPEISTQPIDRPLRVTCAPAGSLRPRNRAAPITSRVLPAGSPGGTQRGAAAPPATPFHTDAFYSTRVLP